MELLGHARSKRRSPGREYVAALAILAVVAGVVLAAGMAARYVQAAAPPLPGPDRAMHTAVPFPHPTRTFTATPTNTPPPCGLMWRPFASPSTASDTLYGVSALSASDLWAAGS